MGIIRANRPAAAQQPTNQLQHQRARAREAGYYQKPSDGHYDEYAQDQDYPQNQNYVQTQQGAYAEVQEYDHAQGYEVPANEALDAALHLASHAYRLSQIEQALGHINHGMQAIQFSVMEEKNQRARSLMILGGAMVAGLVFVGLIPHPVNEQALASKAKAAVLAFAAEYQNMQQTSAAPPQVVAQAPQAAAPVAPSPAPAPVAARAPAPAMDRVPDRVPLASTAALGAQADDDEDISPVVRRLPPMRAAAVPTPPAPPIRVAQVFTPFQNRIRTEMARRGEMIPADWQSIFDREARGDLKGKLQIAAKFLKGEGVSRNQTFAVQLIREAATAGEKEAMMWLAYAYQAGNLGRVDLAQSIHWFETAGKAGISKAYAELGRIYEAGIDGAPDPGTALAWYQRAAQAGDIASAGAVTRLAARAAPAPGTPIARGTPLGSMTQVASAAPIADISENMAENIPITPPPIEEGSTMNVALQPSNDVRASQRMLKALGYRIDRIDGLMGPQTGNAIRGYQRNKMIYPDGEVSPQLMENLLNDMRWGGQ